MASPKLQQLLLFGLLLAAIFCSVPVNSDHAENDLLRGLNGYRKLKYLPALKTHEKATCVADEVADEIEDQLCPRVTAPMRAPPLSNYKKAFTACKIDINQAKNWVILPVCVRERCASLIRRNYTRTPFAKYLSNPKLYGVGIEMEDYWTVVVLAA